MVEWLILIAAAFAAGVLNSIAGGGSFLTFPALVLVGIPPVAANATSAVAVFPGYLGGVVGFKSEIGRLSKPLLTKYLTVSLAGGFGGSLLLLVTSNALFSSLVPWLLLFATILFGLGEQILGKLKNLSSERNHTELPMIFIVAIYGGYFNGGLGIILLAVLLLIGFTDLNLMNGLKNGISFCVSIISVATFAVAGLVHWSEACVMMVAATFGGYYGAVVARKIPPKYLKLFIIFVGLLMSVIFFLRM